VQHPVIQEIKVENWPDFETRLQHIGRCREEREAQASRRLNDPLFRGVGNCEWGLQTTLERSHPTERSDGTLDFLKYYRKAAASKPAIETLTKRRWGGVPDFGKFKRLIEEDKDSSLYGFLTGQPTILEYFIYLRHHGFPSPLLDWTASPYVAAFFAFDGMAKDAKQVCVYAFLQDTTHSGPSDHQLSIFGPYVRSHRRHYAQQSRYSMCVRNDGGNYEICPHMEGTKDALGPAGALFRFRLPAEERLPALKHLDLMNINPFSLYGSEDGLVRTVARRECLFRNWDL
jgi:hypothetical protein